MLSKLKGLMKTRPMVTNSILSGLLGVTGDGISQLAIEKKRFGKDFDYSRSFRFFVVPAFLISPILSKYYPILSKIPGTPKFVPLKMVLVDQIMFAPLFCGAVIFNLRVLEGFSPSKAFESLKTDFVSIYSKSLLFWPFVQLFNFYLAPVYTRVLIVQIASLLWNTFLSFKMNDLEDKDKDF
uniref:Peroxisomal membrane protein PMP22 n=1 Tax=Rhabditophanes sp. KR3021 TaxID=114890 RepID=A0AC35TNN7_9BILA